MPQTPRISFASVVHDPEIAARYLLPSLEALDEPAQALILSNAGNELTTNLASLYNMLMRFSGPERRAFVHPDVTFEPGFVARLSSVADEIEAAGARWGAIGIVGRAWEGGEYVWCHEIEATEPVCTLDSCFLFTRTDLGLRFDAERFDQFHCFVEDYCLQCHAEGYGVWVIPATATHENATFNRLGSRWGNYGRYRKRLDRKWRKQFPELTTV